MILNWFAALAVKLESDKLVPLLPTILEPVLRELSITDEQGVKIRQIAKEVLQYYRQKINSDNYDKVIVDVQRILDVKRAKRKMKITQMVIYLFYYKISFNFYTALFIIFLYLIYYKKLKMKNFFSIGILQFL